MKKGQKSLYKVRIVARSIASISCVVIPIVFLVAANAKLKGGGAFAEDLTNYRLLPAWSIGVVARLVPALEIVIATALLSGIYQRAAAVLSFAMLAVFSAAMLQAVLRGIDLTCGCFGNEAAPVGWSNFIRNSALMLLSLWVVFARQPLWPWKQLYSAKLQPEQLDLSR